MHSKSKLAVSKCHILPKKKNALTPLYCTKILQFH